MRNSMTRKTTAYLLQISTFVFGVGLASADESETRAAKDRAVVEALTRLPEKDRPQGDLVDAAIARHVENQRGTGGFLGLSERFGMKVEAEYLLGICRSDPGGEGARAARLLLAQGGRSQLTAALADEDEEKANAVSEAVGRAGGNGAVELLGAIVLDQNASRSRRTTATSALGKSFPGQKWILSQVAAGAIGEELEFAAADVLFGSNNQQIREGAQKQTHLKRPAAANSTPIPPVAQLVRRRGDIVRGEEVYRKNGTCHQCHKVKGNGKEVGPDLSEIGSKLSRDALYVSILDPSAGVSHNYETYTLATVDGLVISGVLVNKNDKTVTLKTAEAVEKTVAIDDIEELTKSPISLMPANLREKLSVQELVDVVEYMAMLKKAGEKSFYALPGADDENRRELGSAVAGLDVADGLKAELFAGEPLLLSPTNLDVDHLGRVWVCEVVNYRHFRNTNNSPRETGDRILILEDSDGDGKADKTTVFYEGRDIDSAHGVCVLGNKAIVSAGSNVFLLTDEDGDSKADKKEVLFTGISGVQHDHGIHSFAFGPDGKLYFNFGNEGRQLLDKEGKPVVDKAGNVVNDKRQPYQMGMAFRCNLDGSELETIGWNFRNNWELCVDAFGTVWQSDNDDDGNRAVRINFVMEYGNYGYRDEMTGDTWKVPRTGMEAEVPDQHWHLNDPGVVPNLLQTGAGSPTGILIYEGRLLPKRYRGQLIHCDAGPNIVRGYSVKRDGAGYTASILPLLTGVRDNWFRPSDVCVAPDGSLIVADWYDPGVGGHRMGDIQRGRLFRVTPKDTAGYQVPPLDLESVDGAITALSSPNMATRYMAWTALESMDQSAVERALRVAYRGANKRRRVKARLLWALGKFSAKPSDAVTLGLKSKVPNLRAVAVRLSRQLDMDPIKTLEEHVEDKSPIVRREIAIALRHCDCADMPRLWARLAAQHDGKDRWYLEALGIAAEGRWEACYATWINNDGLDLKSAVARDIVWRCRAPQASRHLVRLIVEPDPTDDNLRYLRALDFHSEEVRIAALKDVVRVASK